MVHYQYYPKRRRECRLLPQQTPQQINSGGNYFGSNSRVNLHCHDSAVFHKMEKVCVPLFCLVKMPFCSHANEAK